MNPSDFELTLSGDTGQDPEVTKWIDGIKIEICERLPKMRFRIDITSPVKKSFTGNHLEVVSEAFYYQALFGSVSYTLEVVN